MNLSLCVCIIQLMCISKSGRGWMRMRYFLAALPLFAAGTGWCADTSGTPDPLLDLFIQKGYVTQQEAAKVKAEADRLRTNELANASMPAPQWKINPGIKNMEIFGDVRLRYEDRSANDPTGGNIDYQRMRYAVRFGLRGSLLDDFYYGYSPGHISKSPLAFCHVRDFFRQRLSRALRQIHRRHQYRPGLHRLASAGLGGYHTR